MRVSGGRNTPDWSDAVIERGTQGARRVYRIWRLTVPLNKESKQAVVAEVAARVAKNCSPSCCTLCKHLFLALRALWPRWQKRNKAKKPLRNVLQSSVIDRWLYPNSI